MRERRIGELINVDFMNNNIINGTNFEQKLEICIYKTFRRNMSISVALADTSNMDS